MSIDQSKQGRYQFGFRFGKDLVSFGQEDLVDNHSSPSRHVDQSQGLLQTLGLETGFKPSLRFRKTRV
jgi:hypothetical protein